MSYCVNCGVELDQTARSCALCNTPVVNPSLLRQSQEEKNRMISPYPRQSGEVEDVKRGDVIILLTVVFGSTALICGLLNLFVFSSNRWSLAVIGACATLWVMFVPVLMIKKLPIYLAILLDGLIVAVYLYMLVLMVDTDRWYYGLGLPIVLLVTLIVEVMTLCFRKLPREILVVALYLFTAIGVLLLGLEGIIDYYLRQQIQLAWSLLVGTILLLIDIAIITLLSRRRLRDAVRRRLHF